MSLKIKLEMVEPSQQNRKEYMPYMSNWVVMSKMLKRLSTPHQVLMMIKIELMNKKRPEIIFRLHSRYNALRRVNERKELMEIMHEGNGEGN